MEPKKTLDQAWDTWEAEALEETRLIEAVNQAIQALSKAQGELKDFKRSSELWVYYELKAAGYAR